MSQIVPFLEGGIAAPETHQGDQINPLVFGHGADEAGDLAHNGIIRIVLKHIDHLVIGAVGPGVRI